MDNFVEKDTVCPAALDGSIRWDGANGEDREEQYGVGEEELDESFQQPGVPDHVTCQNG